MSKKTNAKSSQAAKKETIQRAAPKASNKKQAKRDAAPLETDALKDAPLLAASDDAAPLGVLSAQAETSDGAALEIAAAPPTEPLRLPKGAFLIFRKSGGLRFSSREVLIYPDGRVAYDARGVPQKEYNRLRRALNDGQMLSLRKLLDATNFWRAESMGQQNPDAFAYELAARIGQRSNQIEVFDGSVPENLKPLIERLTPLLAE
ncbi:MAG: hypothetical protein BroJett039_13820 [Chloroflexota bacterium]|nr:MAG: hypothetical protein BroJett039_13820 [Chloroflexota bacterium]